MEEAESGEFDTLSAYGSLSDLLNSLNDGLDMPVGSDVDDLLDAFADEAQGAGAHNSNSEMRRDSFGSLDLESAALESASAFSEEKLVESLAKFNDFMERQGINLDPSDEFGSCHPVATSAQVGKRNREHEIGLHDYSAHSREQADVLDSKKGASMRIRTISGGNLPSVSGTMRHGYATTSSIHDQANRLTDFFNPAQNDIWAAPEEPIVGEVSGTKMRRLLSNNSYFHSRSAENGVSKNASWGEPKRAQVTFNHENGQTAFSSNARGASLVDNMPGFVHRMRNAGFSGPKVARPGMTTLSRSRVSLPSLTLNTVPEASSPTDTPNASWFPQKHGVGTMSMSAMQNMLATSGSMPGGRARNASWQTPKPSSGGVTFEEMQRLAGTGVTFPSQGSSIASARASLSGSSTSKSSFGTVSLEEMYRLATTGASFPSQESLNVSARGSLSSSSKSSFGTVSLEEMQHLASTGASFPVQGNRSAGTSNTATTSSFQATKSSFGTVSLEEMQRLAGTGASFPVQAGTTTNQFVQSQQPPLAASVSLEETRRRLASTGASFPFPRQPSATTTATPAPSAESQSSVRVVSLEEMQHLVNAGASFPLQRGATMTASRTSFQASRPSPVTVTLEDLRRLQHQEAPANFSGASNAMGNVSTTSANSSFQGTPKSLTGSVSLEELPHLASTVTSFPIQGRTSSRQNEPTTTMTGSLGSVSAQSFQNLSSGGAVPKGRMEPPPNRSTVKQSPITSSNRSLRQTLKEMQRLTQTTPSSTVLEQHTFSSENQTNNVAAYDSLTGLDPASGKMTIQQVLHLAKASTDALAQATPAASGSGSQAMFQVTGANTAVQQQKCLAGAVSLEEVQHLAATGTSFQGTGRNASLSGAIMLEEMQRLASTGARFPLAQEGTTVQQPKSLFGAGAFEELQRLVTTTASIPPPEATMRAQEMPGNSMSSAAWPTPTAVEATNLEEMQRFATQQVILPQALVTLTAGGSRDSLHSAASSTLGSATLEALQRASSNASMSANPLSGSFQGSHNVFCPSDGSSAPRKINGGRIQSLWENDPGLQQSGVESESTGAKNAEWEAVKEAAPPSQPNLNDSSESQDYFDANEMMKSLTAQMQKSSTTQKALQNYDRERGLPRSHSQTMVNSSRSRKQLQEGKIIAKWDGSPLISDETELGKPKPRAPRRKDDDINK